MTTTESLELTSEDIIILEALLAQELSKRERGMGSVTLDGHDRAAFEPFVRLRSKLRRLDEEGDPHSHIDRPL